MKAMSVAMVFTLIFAIIVITFVMFFGYDTIKNTLCLGGDSQVMKSFNDIENRIKDIYTKTMGSSDVIEVSIPSGTKICFVNTENPETNIAGNWFPTPDIKDIISRKGYNVWLDMCREDMGRTINKLVVDNSFCITSSSEIYIENMGTYVSIQKNG